MTDPLIGRQLGRYNVRALLGQGGTARVYRALDQQLQRDVAIKILSDAALRDPEFIERFDREAQTLAGLRHPHIVQIYDYGQQDSLGYIVTQLLPGATLEAELNALNARNERMEMGKLLQTLTQISSALDYAHKQGIIHRDIKPGNVIRDASGDAVLTDFGIARAAASSGVTQVGTVIGTPAYLSPEQAQGATLSPASDIYALGVLAYELLTGRVPFQASNPMSILVDHVQTSPPAPSLFRTDLPVAVDQVLLKVLAKSPAERFPSAGAFVRALGMALQKPVAAPVVTPPATHDQQTVVNQTSPPPLNVHDQPTLANPNLPQPQPSPQAAPRSPVTQSLPPPVPPPIQPRAYRRNPWPLIIGLLVGLALLGGAIAAIGNRGDTDGSANLPATAVLPSPAATEPQPTAEPPTAEPPTAEPPTAEPPTAEPPTAEPPTAEPPTEAPPQPTEPPVPPTEAPAAEPPILPTVVVVTQVAPPVTDVGALVAATQNQLSAMRNIIEANRTAQTPIAGETADALIDGVNDLEEAIGEGNKANAIKELDKVWRDIGNDVEKRRIPEDMGKQLRNLLLQIRGALK